MPVGRKGYLTRTPPFLHRPDLLAFGLEFVVDVTVIRNLARKQYCFCLLRPKLPGFEVGTRQLKYEVA